MSLADLSMWLVVVAFGAALASGLVLPKRTADDRTRSLHRAWLAISVGGTWVCWVLRDFLVRAVPGTTSIETLVAIAPLEAFTLVVVLMVYIWIGALLGFWGKR